VSEQIYSEGKIKFTSRLHARQVQYQLKQAGFEYETGSQRIRPGAYGVMWSNEFQGVHRKKKNMCTAGNERVFTAYGAHRKDTIYLGYEATVNNEPGRSRVFQNIRDQQEKTNQIVERIFEYMLSLNIGYDFTAKRTKKGTPIRNATWHAFAWLLHEQHPNAKPFQVKRAIRKHYKNAPEDRKLKELLKSSRPQGLPIM